MNVLIVIWTYNFINKYLFWSRKSDTCPFIHNCLHNLCQIEVFAKFPLSCPEIELSRINIKKVLQVNIYTKEEKKTEERRQRIYTSIKAHEYQHVPMYFGRKQPFEHLKATKALIRRCRQPFNLDILTQ